LAKIQTVKEYLSTHGPSLSSDIAAALRKNGISDVAARKRLSRLPSEVMALSALTFPKRARFLYLEHQFGKDKYWIALHAAIKQSNPAYAAAIGAVRACGGYIRRKDFDVISGSPLRQKKQISSETVLNRLCAVSILDKTDDPVHGECIYFRPQIGEIPARRITLRARLVTEDVLLDAIRSWAGKMNISSPNVTRIRGDSDPQYVTFRFHLCGPSYLRPIRHVANGKMTRGFFVADVILGTHIAEDGVDAFIRKCMTLSRLPSTRPFLPMFIAESFTPEALKACRTQGVMATTPTTLFGAEVAAALVDLMKTLTNAATVAATKPDLLENLFKKLSGIEGQAGNLRGALFELLVGHMVKQLEGNSIDIGKIIQCEDDKSREMDVCRFKEKTVAIYECKGYQPTSVVTKPEIEKWLQAVAQIYSAHKAQEAYINSSFSFEYWTCGMFDEEALAYLKNVKAKVKKYFIEWKDGDAVRKYASQMSALASAKFSMNITSIIRSILYPKPPPSYLRRAERRPDARSPYSF
jgi:hypothetical protein